MKQIYKSKWLRDKEAELTAECDVEAQSQPINGR